MKDLLRGDFRFFWPESIQSFLHFPSTWDSSLNTGIGINDTNTLWITSYLNFTSIFTQLGVPWFWTSLVFWFLPPIILSFVGAYLLFKNLIAKNGIFAFISGIIFASNTYFLTVFGGGQAGVSFAYSLVPFVFLAFLYVLKKENLSSSLIAGLVFAAQILFDPRFAFITAIFFAVFYFLSTPLSKNHIKYLVIIPGICAGLLHSFWILPLVLFKSQILPQGYDTLESVRFFSFANFENTISLLHPNWPENIFGKTYFMRPEFLLLPIFAFLSLLFIGASKLKERKNILSFSLLALVAAFLAKGANEPFGELYIWIFNNLPGGSFFRDSTKFYSIVALAFSILIPFSLIKMSEVLKKIRNPQILVFVFFIVFWIFSLRLLFSPSVKTFRIHSVPESYNNLRNFIVSEDSYFRTLWAPQWQRYGYFSDTNPAIGREEFFKIASASSILSDFEKQEFRNNLEKFGVKYVIVPEDSEGEIFVDDRKYNDSDYKEMVMALEKVPWLNKVAEFGKIVIFETPSYKNRYYFEDKGEVIASEMISPTQHRLKVRNNKKENILVFSESFDKNWYVKSKTDKIYSMRYGSGMNSFVLPKEGEYDLEIYYEPQKLSNFGQIISLFTLIAMSVFLFEKNKKLFKKNKK